MGAALSIFVLLSLSIFVVRVAAVALRLTGLEDSCARFQALSAFSTTGFTTREAESIVNYPVRRRIVSVLMIIGNLGLVTVFATLVVSLVHTEGEVGAVMAQLAWLSGGLALLWFLMLNPTADRIMCASIGRMLEATTLLGRRPFYRLLQLGDGYSVCEHQAASGLLDEQGTLREPKMAELGLSLLAVRSRDGHVFIERRERGIEPGDTLILVGPDTGHEALGDTQASPNAAAV